MKRTIQTLGILVAAVLMLAALRAPALAGSGGSGGGGGGGSTETIKVSKCEYAASNFTMLINASSSNSSAHLYAYLPNGAYLGEVQNGGGGRYGGTVFFAMTDPGWITIISSTGASVTAPATPFQP